MTDPRLRDYLEHIVAAIERVAHYLEVVWTTVVQDLPGLAAAVRRLLAEQT